MPAIETFFIHIIEREDEMIQLDELYGVNLGGFSAILSEHGVSLDDVINIAKAEIDALERNYSRILGTRDCDDFDQNLAIGVQDALKRKREKLDRYHSFFYGVQR